MGIEHKERVQILHDQDIEQRRKIVEDRPSTQTVLLSRLSRLIWFMVAVVVIMIAFRFVLMVLAANPANGFTNFIYSVTGVFVAPFVGLIQSPAFEGGSVIDIASLFAVIIYPLIGWGLVELLHIFFGSTGRIRRVKTLRRENLD